MSEEPLFWLVHCQAPPLLRAHCEKPASFQKLSLLVRCLRNHLSSPWVSLLGHPSALTGGCGRPKVAMSMGCSRGTAP